MLIGFSKLRFRTCFSWQDADSQDRLALEKGDASRPFSWASRRHQGTIARMQDLKTHVTHQSASFQA
ncbi:hypothetical protein [Ectopseudomonas khazarica]|uniref:hypothetical protein n=1 Tax=Ectopseudomonas khazarica TaxID=2502979 RepID=UPI0037C75BFC